MIKKHLLLNLVADLVEMLVEYGANEDSIIETLIGYNITKEECKEWYGLEHSGFKTFNEAPYGGGKDE